MQPLEYKQKIIQSIGNEIGDYIFPNGSKDKAITILPDPDIGYNYPELGTKVEGLEVIINLPYSQPKNLISGDKLLIKIYQVILKQWDSSKSLINTVESLCSLDWEISTVVISPKSDKLKTLEQARIEIIERLIVADN